MNESFEARYLSGMTLYGDDFDESAIRKWYTEEEYGLRNGRGRCASSGPRGPFRRD